MIDVVLGFAIAWLIVHFLPVAKCWMLCRCSLAVPGLVMALASSLCRCGGPSIPPVEPFFDILGGEQPHSLLVIAYAVAIALRGAFGAAGLQQTGGELESRLWLGGQPGHGDSIDHPPSSPPTWPPGRCWPSPSPCLRSPTPSCWPNAKPTIPSPKPSPPSPNGWEMAPRWPRRWGPGDAVARFGPLHGLSDLGSRLGAIFRAKGALAAGHLQSAWHAIHLSPATEFDVDVEDTSYLDDRKDAPERWVLPRSPAPPPHLVVLELDGERVSRATPHIGYLHSGFEGWASITIGTSTSARSVGWTTSPPLSMTLLARGGPCSTSTAPRVANPSAPFCASWGIKITCCAWVQPPSTWAGSPRSSTGSTNASLSTTSLILFLVNASTRTRGSVDSRTISLAKRRSKPWSKTSSTNVCPRRLGLETMLNRNRIFIDRLQGVGVIKQEAVTGD